MTKTKVKEKCYKIDVTPDKSLLDKMGNSGHNFYESVAEFVDNSIDARTPEQLEGKEKLIINIRINAKKNFFSIEDNASGMNEETAQDAAALGKSSKTSDKLGSFGIGLKSGAMTIADNFVVETTQKDEDISTQFEYNHGDWIKSKEWTLPAKQTVVDKDKHGTKITINRVNKIKMTPAKTAYLKGDIGQRYRSFIEDGVDIRINNKKVPANEIKWAEGYPKDINVETEYGKITGKIGLMTESSQKGNYGFDMFRNGRMITTNCKFAIKEHPTSARIFGIINLDFVGVSHEKNKFMVDSKRYEVAEKACRNSDIFKEISSAARKKSEDTVNKKENDAIDKFIEDSMPMIAQAVKELEQDFPFDASGTSKGFGKSKRGKILGNMFNLGKKTRGGYNKSGAPSTPTQNPNPNPNQNDDGEIRGEIIELHNQSFNIKREFISEKNLGRKSISFDENEGVLTVMINNAYAGYKATKDKNSYCLETVQDAIVEFLYKESGEVIDKINECKEKLVTATSNLANAFGDDLLS